MTAADWPAGTTLCNGRVTAEWVRLDEVRLSAYFGVVYMQIEKRETYEGFVTRVTKFCEGKF